ncbi:Thromboxane-A synthase [Toxocara canis]|uniref:Thromboxane-A synthase n=1 Tax=Toxocara canis TaxID=6265 RepID=A0A0B2VK39_TOXCA|nr:Thromboxane-A synthase [Toxocara canis]
MLPELLLSFLIVLLLCLLMDRHLKIRRRAEMGLCGPPAVLLLGNLHQMGAIMAKNGQLLYNVFEEWKKEYGKLYGFLMGPRLFVIVENLDTVREVLIKRFDCFVDRMELDFLSNALSASLVATKGTAWKEMRSCLSPTFTSAKMRTMSIIVHEKLDIFMGNVACLADNKICFDIYE